MMMSLSPFLGVGALVSLHHRGTYAASNMNIFFLLQNKKKGTGPVGTRNLFDQRNSAELARLVS